MKLIKISLLSIISILAACSESVPTVDELVKNDDLYKQVRAECKSLGNRYEQIKHEKCVNLHKAADKKQLSLK